MSDSKLIHSAIHTCMHHITDSRVGTHLDAVPCVLLVLGRLISDSSDSSDRVQTRVQRFQTQVQTQVRPRTKSLQVFSSSPVTHITVLSTSICWTPPYFSARHGMMPGRLTIHGIPSWLWTGSVNLNLELYHWLLFLLKCFNSNCGILVKWLTCCVRVVRKSKPWPEFLVGDVRWMASDMDSMGTWGLWNFSEDKMRWVLDSCWRN